MNFKNAKIKTNQSNIEIIYGGIKNENNKQNCQNFNAYNGYKYDHMDCALMIILSGAPFS
jgi:hypothetical protein